MADAPISEELTALKKRARRRLVGAVALVFVALIVLWTVMDDKPPQSLVNEPVAIVSSTPALASTVRPDPTVQPPAVASEPLAEVQGAESTALAEPDTPITLPATKPALPSQVAVPESKPLEKKPAPAVPKKDPAHILADIEDDASKPVASKPVSKDEIGQGGEKAAGKFFLQIGAFADQSKAQALQTKAQAAGVKVQTEAVKTDKGELTRLRAGPYSNRDLAEEAHDKLAAAGVSSSIVGK